MHLNAPRIVVVALVFSCLAIAGCKRVQPVYNVPSHAVPAAARDLPQVRVEQAAFDAATSLGWSVERVQPGQLRAKQSWRTHVMVVEIAINDSAYSIRHIDSINLKESGDQIHRSYNARVKRLEEEIERRLYRATY